ncbi:hypothetical protein FSP39_004573 [Pinctada imbricata]|uniref:Uncharacterized protein n=1 Tax=Pinctada imbricata TaxID=66713 RepID=A0AA89BYN8_PINIB|nr:hypothetical protein FSP39_004573 [Pinctada imbricata]
MASTEAITSYDGIFKGMYNSSLRALFVEFREQLAVGNWVKGRQILQKAIQEASSEPRDLKTLKLIESEVNRYEKYKMKNVTPAQDANWNVVKERKIERLDESLFELPQVFSF